MIGQRLASRTALATVVTVIADAFLAANWLEHQFSLSLDQSLIAALEDEARWMIGNNVTTDKAVPDFLNYVYPDALKVIIPGAVNISP